MLTIPQIAVNNQIFTFQWATDDNHRARLIVLATGSHGDKYEFNLDGIQFMSVSAIKELCHQKVKDHYASNVQ